MSKVQTLSVESDEDGLRLDRWFKRRYPGLGHGPLEKLLRTGQVRVDGGRVKAGDRIKSGQIIRIPPLPESASEAPETTTRVPTGLTEDDKTFVQGLVIHMDSDVIVLNKPAGLAVQGGTGLHRHLDGLLDGLRFGKSQRPRIVHRLDKDTSGVIVIARTQPAAAKLSEAFREREARKVYWALVAGLPKPAKGTIKLALAKEGGHGEHGRDEKMTVVEDIKTNPDAQKAVTHYAVVDRAADKATWVAFMPVTGRTHQLRVHAAALGTPIVGDYKYGGEESRLTGEVSRKLHLHARSMRIRHPAGGWLEATAPLPSHMLKSWTLLAFDPENDGEPFKGLKD